MSIRTTHEIDDIQRCIVALYDEVSDTPITDAEIIFGYPEADRFIKFEKAIVYVLEPVRINKYSQQGGVPIEKEWELITGVWTDNNTGGIEEANLLCSWVANFFDDTQNSHATQTFSVTLGSTSYSDTNLLTMGIRVQDVLGPRKLVVQADLKEHRRELTLSIST